MIQYNSINSFKEIHYNGHSIKSVYDYQANKVWPTIPSVYKWLATYSDSHTESEECDSSSAITWGEVESTNLIDVQIGDCVTVIDDGAFEYCHSLSSVTIPNNVITIGEEAFINCDISYLTIGSGVTSIGISAFNGCQNLSSVTIPNSVITIGNNAFDNCITLTSITIGSSVQTIGASAFTWCTRLSSVTIPDSVTTIGDYAFYLNWGVRSLTLGSGVTSIGVAAFAGLTQITSLDIPNSVTSIGMGAFHSCYSLTSCTIGSGVTTISDRAFYKFKNISGVTINATTPPTIGTSVFDGENEDEQEIAYTYPIYVPCGSVDAYKAAWTDYASRIQANDSCPKKLIATYTGGTVTSTLCDGTSAITSGEVATANLVAVEIGDCVTSIGDNAFYGCSGLTSVTIPSSVTSIGTYGFGSCRSLTSITIPHSVTSIGKSAFYNCGLTSVTIPNSVANMGTAVFKDCPSLTSVTIGSGITSISDDTFRRCSGLTNVDIPNSVTSIGKNVFYQCIGLTSVTIPNSVTSIGNNVFNSCSGLTSCTIGSGVTSIGNDAFNRCSELTAITCYATTPPTVQVRALANTNDCPIYVPCDSLADYQTAWSDYSSRLQCIPTPSYKWLATYSDSHTESAACDSTSAITYGEVNLQALYEVQIGDCATSIDQYAFGDSTAITSITIGSGVTSIGAYAFMNSEGLQSVTINATTPPSIGEYVFGINNNCPIYVPSQSVSAYQTAWSGYSSRIQAIP